MGSRESPGSNHEQHARQTDNQEQLRIGSKTFPRICFSPLLLLLPKIHPHTYRSIIPVVDMATPLRTSECQVLYLVGDLLTKLKYRL